MVLVLSAQYVENDDPPICLDVTIAPENILINWTFDETASSTDRFLI